MRVSLQWVNLCPLTEALEEVEDDRTITREEWRLGYRQARMEVRARIKRLCQDMSRPGASFGTIHGVQVLKSSDLLQ